LSAGRLFEMTRHLAFVIGIQPRHFSKTHFCKRFSENLIKNEHFQASGRFIPLVGHYNFIAEDLVHEIMRW